MKKRRRKEKQLQFLLPIYSLEHGQTSVASLLKKTKSFPTSTCARKYELWRATLPGSLSQFLRVIFDGFLSRLLLFWWGKALSQEPSMSLFLKCESAVIAATAKVASLALYCEQEHRSWTPRWFLGTAQTSTWLTKIT